MWLSRKIPATENRKKQAVHTGKEWLSKFILLQMEEKIFLNRLFISILYYDAFNFVQN